MLPAEKWQVLNQFKAWAYSEPSSPVTQDLHVWDLFKSLTVISRSISFDGKLFPGSVLAEVGARLAAFRDAGTAAPERGREAEA